MGGSVGTAAGITAVATATTGITGGTIASKRKIDSLVDIETRIALIDFPNANQ